MSYIIIELNTGALDGYYADREDALDMLENFYATEYPWGKWVLAEFTKSAPNGSRLPDARCYSRMFDNVPAGITSLETALGYLHAGKNSGNDDSESYTREELEPAQEIAFRRGYQHGWLFATQAIKSGSSIESVRSFAKNELQDWRYSRNRKKVEPPVMKNDCTGMDS